MESTRSRLWLREAARVGAIAGALATAGIAEVAGQAPLAIKTSVAGLDRFECPVWEAPAPPTPDEAREAAQLGSTARQAVILGDLARAQELLSRAVSLDGVSGDLAYRLGRVLEDRGERREAVLQFCRSLGAGLEGEDARDARDRVEAYAEGTRRRVPPAALEAFRAGVEATGQMRLAEALEAFTSASERYDDFAEAEFNRGVLLESLERPTEAAEAFRSYLVLRPEAPDAIQVSERIGQLQVVPGAVPSAGSAFALGMVLPGGGQFYTGRPLGGVVMLALAGGAAAAGYFIEETDVRCLEAVEPGESCPPDQVVARTTDRPYLVYGVAGAAALALAGAVEAFFHARGMDGGVEVATLGDGTRLLGPSVQARGLRADVRFFRVTF